MTSDLPTGGLDPAATDLVLRRAVELTAVEPSTGDIELSAEAVAAIAAEVGVPAEKVAASLAEHHAGVHADRRLVDRIIGPRVVWARRMSSLGEEATREQAQKWLSSGHGLRPRVRSDGVVVASRRRGVIGRVAGGVRRATTGGGGLSRVRQVHVAAVDVDDRPGAVCVAVDVSNKRAEAMAGGVAVASGGAVFVGLVAIFTGPTTLVALPIAAGAGAVTSRVVHRLRLRRITDDVEEVIDAIASGEAPPSVVDWRRQKND